MSHADPGPLSTYNSLCDPNLAGYFSDNKKRRHLRKSGLISKKGAIVTETTYRLNMARKEHKKHVRDLLSQAIVHKTLDMERVRQGQIKKKLEEIGKIELVRRIRIYESLRRERSRLPLVSLSREEFAILFDQIAREIGSEPIKSSHTEKHQDKKESERNPWKHREYFSDVPYGIPPYRHMPTQTMVSGNLETYPAERARKGDEDILPYLSPRGSRTKSERPSSVPSSRVGRGSGERPTSAPQSRMIRSQRSSISDEMSSSGDYGRPKSRVKGKRT